MSQDGVNKARRTLLVGATAGVGAVGAGATATADWLAGPGDEFRVHSQSEFGTGTATDQNSEFLHAIDFRILKSCSKHDAPGTMHDASM